MTIEEEVFKRCNINYKKIEKYGFKLENNIYIYEKCFLDNEFKAIIKIDNNKITGKVIDLQMNEEYTNIRTEMNGEFVNKVREEYKLILNDIKNNCFDTKYFIFEQTNRINKYIKDKYNIDPEFLWEKFPGFSIYRNKSNNKWFGLISNIDYSKIDNKTGEIEILNIKLNSDKIKELLNKKGFYKAYHMNKVEWITLLLDDTLEDDEIFKLIDESYNIIDEPIEWIIPANPKYYDVISAFNNKEEVIWKQSSDIHINDIIYIYVIDPYSKIMYKCKTIEVNIPYEYKDKNVSMNRVMRLKLIKKLDNKNYTFEYLNNLGIKAIRGPRKINKEISERLK